MQNNPTFAFALDLVNEPELIAAYEEHHRAVWPEILTALHQVGILEMQIFRLDTRLFMHCTCITGFEPERDFARYMELDEKIPLWEELMNRFQQPLPQAQPGEKWLAMENIFTMSTQLETLGK